MPKTSIMNLMLEKIPFIFFSLFSCIIAYYAETQVNAVRSIDNFSIAVRISNALVSYIRYIWKLIYPVKLACFYPHTGMPEPWKVVGSALIIISGCIIVIRYYKQHPYILTGWLWYLLTLVPVIGLIQIGSHSHADRYAYIPLIGIFVIISWGAYALMERWRYLKIFIPFSAAAVIAVLFICTRAQTAYWKDGCTVFEHALQVTPKNSIILNNLGNALARKGRLKDAFARFSEGLIIRPDDPELHNNIANVLAAEGKLSEAQGHYAEALRSKPDFVSARYGLKSVKKRMEENDSN